MGNTKIALRQYQTNLINDVAKLYGQGVRRVLVQSSTGSGKTIAFSALTQRFMQKLNKIILYLTHLYIHHDLKTQELFLNVEYLVNQQFISWKAEYLRQSV